MATTATILQDAILKIGQQDGYWNAQNDSRQSNYGALSAIMESTEKCIPASMLAEIKQATAQPTKIDVFVKEPLGTETARACSGTGSPTTNRTTLTYQGFQEQFALSEIEFAGNEVRKIDAFNHLLSEKLRSLRTRIDSAAVAFLEANKAVGGGAGTIYTTIVADAKRVPNADKFNFFNNVSVEMAENDYNGPYYNVSSTSNLALQRYDIAQGANNGTNLQFQMGDYLNKYTNRIVKGVGVTSTSFMFAPGQVGMIPWINTLSRTGKDIGTDSWSSFVDPATGMPIELKVKKTCVDNSANFAGAEADFLESYVLYTEIAFVKAFSSTTNTGIFKYEIL